MLFLTHPRAKLRRSYVYVIWLIDCHQYQWEHYGMPRETSRSWPICCSSTGAENRTLDNHYLSTWIFIGFHFGSEPKWNHISALTQRQTESDSESDIEITEFRSGPRWAADTVGTFERLRRLSTCEARWSQRPLPTSFSDVERSFGYYTLDFRQCWPTSALPTHPHLTTSLLGPHANQTSLPSALCL